MLNLRSNRTVFPAVLSIGLLVLALPSGEAQTAPGAKAAHGTASRAVTAPVQPPYVPLTGSDRLHRYLLGLVSPGAVVRSAAAAGINQWNDTPTEWHQGADAYGRRFASSYGGHIVRQSLQAGLGALFDEDNRYVPSTASGTMPRLGYAVSSTFMARSHTGARKVSISAIGSLVGSAFISRAWQPASTSHASNAATSLAVTAGVNAGFHVAREFFPHVMHGWFWH